MELQGGIYWDSANLNKICQSAHIVPESENLITGLQMTHLIVCL